ncbi:hypothetical protein [Candidatus Nitrosotalea okcheonensis]|uniref:Putative Extracellular protein n=1 Tax=Candidatus Nitrosotalea okcheonensis TaxID=1903276 RepID=A0A2H1FE62_9ARCH|nr:hypothetical protein [Candidatus Nitrosotalea okcheonensis]SMH71045.1 putative Extracellular protein [Candidatus Nitrosotalea okcheonensis]
MIPKKYLYAAISGIVIIAIVVVIQLVPQMASPNATSNQVAFLDFTYDEENSDLKSTLALHHINMTNPITLSSAADIKQYCNFITDPKKQALVTHCTSTVLKDKQGNLGDIDMVGSPNVPGLVVVALQLDPTMSDYVAVKTVFGVVLNSTVCQCWDKENPGGYSTLSDMMDALRNFHVNGKQPDSTTHTVPLGNKHFEIELSTTKGGYLWKLLVAK